MDTFNVSFQVAFRVCFIFTLITGLVINCYTDTFNASFQVPLRICFIFTLITEVVINFSMDTFNVSFVFVFYSYWSQDFPLQVDKFNASFQVVFFICFIFTLIICTHQVEVYRRTWKKSIESIQWYYFLLRVFSMCLNHQIFKQRIKLVKTI